MRTKVRARVYWIDSTAVIPVKTGIQFCFKAILQPLFWIPTCVGMTDIYEFNIRYCCPFLFAVEMNPSQI